MSEDVDHEALTQCGATELGVAIPETGPQLAYSAEAEVFDYPESASRMRVALIAGGIIAAAGLVAGTVFAMGRPEPIAPSSVAAPISSPVPTSAPPLVVQTTTVVVAAPPSQSEPSAVIPTLHGSAFVRTQSGKTVCQVTAGEVACNVAFVRPTPIIGGLPASGFRIFSGGGGEWLTGDPGNPDYTTLAYGAVYRVLGWTIKAASSDTTFRNDQTGHGVTVSVEGFTRF